MASSVITLCQNVEQKWFHIEIESFMVQKEFSEQAKILAVGLQEQYSRC